MAITVNVNGVPIQYPQTGDPNWGENATNFAIQTSSAFGKLGLDSGTSVDIPQTLDVTGNTTLDANLFVGGVIYADDSTTANTPVISFTGDTNTGIGRSSADTLDFITNGNSRFRIESTGQIKAVYESQVGTDYNTLLANGYLCRAWVNFNGQTNNNLSGTYSQSGTTVTVTATSHGYIVGNLVSIDITTGTAVDGGYLVTEVIDSNNFRYTAGTSLTTSGNCLLVRSTIRASGNVSSISYNGTGDYTVNFTTPMPDIFYAILTSNEQTTGNVPVNISRNNSRTDTEYRTNICTSQGSTLVNISWVSIGIFK